LGPDIKLEKNQQAMGSPVNCLLEKSDRGPEPEGVLRRGGWRVAEVQSA
jgi:hypothetical protein